MCKDFLISVAENREKDVRLKVVMTEASIPRGFEAISNKEYSMGRRLWEIGEIRGTEVWSEMWSRLTTVSAMLKANTTVVSVKTKQDDRMIILAEGPTRPRERTLWALLTKEEKAAWLQKQYSLIEGEMRVIWTAEELVEKVRELEEVGIVMFEF